MKMKKFVGGITAGLVCGLIFAIITIVYGLLVKGVIAPSAIKGAEFFKDLGAEQYLMLFGMNIISGIFWGIIFILVRKGLPHNWFLAGMLFGIYIWLIGRLPLLGFIAITTTLAGSVISLWIIGAFLVCFIGSLFLSITYSSLISEKKKEPEKKEIPKTETIATEKEDKEKKE
ncbi:MAG: hypothetical protein ACUVWP_08755 [bacterium]